MKLREYLEKHRMRWVCLIHLRRIYLFRLPTRSREIRINCHSAQLRHFKALTKRVSAAVDWISTVFVWVSATDEWISAAVDWMCVVIEWILAVAD